MKFGLVYYPNTDNIGDDIQSYAAMCQLPQVDYLIDREHMDMFAPEKDGEQVAVIMNGWFLHHRYNWPPSPYICPLLISMHIDTKGYIIEKDSFLEGISGAFLKKYGPVGVRDLRNLEIMERLGIEAYHSGCMTLTIPREENVVREDEILLVDLEQKQTESALKRFPEARIAQVSHTLTEEDREPWEKRMTRVKALLSRYQRAKCVITSRLHCALPCLALGTPVLMVYKDDYFDRIGSFLKLLHYCRIEEYDTAVEEFIRSTPENKDDYLTIRSDLIRRCQEFTSLTKDVEKLEEVPPLSLFRSFWQEKAQWQKAIMDQQLKAYQNAVAELKHYIGEQDRSKEWFLSQIESKDRRIQELEIWTAELEDAKSWLLSQIESKDACIQELDAKLSRLKSDKVIHGIIKVRQYEI